MNFHFFSLLALCMLPPCFFLLNKRCTWDDSPSPALTVAAVWNFHKPFQKTSTCLMSVLCLLEFFLSDFLVSLLRRLDPWSIFVPVYQSCTFLLAFWVLQRTLQLILIPLAFWDETCKTQMLRGCPLQRNLQAFLRHLFEIVFVIRSFKLQLAIDLTGTWPKNGKKNGYLVIFTFFSA